MHPWPVLFPTGRSHGSCHRERSSILGYSPCPTLFSLRSCWACGFCSAERGIRQRYEHLLSAARQTTTHFAMSFMRQKGSSVTDEDPDRTPFGFIVPRAHKHRYSLQWSLSRKRQRTFPFPVRSRWIAFFTYPSFSPYQQATFASGCTEKSVRYCFCGIPICPHYYLTFMQKSQRSFPRPSVMLLSQISFGCSPV